MFEQVTAYAHRLMDRLTKHDPQTGVVEISDFDAAIASIREYADKCAAIFWERQWAAKHSAKNSAQSTKKEVEPRHG